jgi:hypothetical protein
VLIRFAYGNNSEVENKFLINNSFRFLVDHIPLYFKIIYTIYLLLCIVIYISKDKYIEIKSADKTVEEELNDDEMNDLIYSLPVKSYVFSRKLKEIRDFVNRDLYMDDTTYRQFFRQLLANDLNSDVIEVFKQTLSKQKLFRNKIIASILMIVLLFFLLYLTNKLNVFFDGNSNIINIFWCCILGIVLFEIFMLISYIESSKLLYGILLSSRDRKFIDEENAKNYEF